MIKQLPLSYSLKLMSCLEIDDWNLKIKQKGYYEMDT